MLTKDKPKADGIWRPEEFGPDGWIVQRYVGNRREVVQFRGHGPVVYGSFARAKAECDKRNGS